MTVVRQFNRHFACRHFPCRAYGNVWRGDCDFDVFLLSQNGTGLKYFVVVFYFVEASHCHVHLVISCMLQVFTSQGKVSAAMIVILNPSGKVYICIFRSSEIEVLANPTDDEVL